jgi:hypothetical protein
MFPSGSDWSVAQLLITRISKILLRVVGSELVRLQIKLQKASKLASWGLSFSK